MCLKWFSLIRRWTLKKSKKIRSEKIFFFRSENFEKHIFSTFFWFFHWKSKIVEIIEIIKFQWKIKIFGKYFWIFQKYFSSRNIFFRSEFFDRICFKFISWSRRIILKKSGVDSDSLEVRKHEDRRIRVSGLRKSKIWSVYTSGAASSKIFKMYTIHPKSSKFSERKKIFFSDRIFFGFFLKFISWSRRII